MSMASTGYTARQLLSYHAYCKSHPDGHVLPPGGRRHWDDMRVRDWLSWFHECLTRKVSRGTEATGNGNRAKRRAKAMADAKAECKWCGAKTGAANKQFCCGDCHRSCYG